MLQQLKSDQWSFMISQCPHSCTQQMLIIFCHVQSNVHVLHVDWIGLVLLSS